MKNCCERNNGLLFSNAVYQTIYQIVVTLTPLITTPYISRELGAEKLGQFSYSYSIVNYFTLVAMLGVINYGSRTIAEHNKEPDERNKYFWGIYYLQLLCTLLSFLLYILFCFLFIDSKNRALSLLQSLWIVSCAFDVNWFFCGTENFKIIVGKNIAIKILSVISIVLFVKKDCFPLLVYTGIMSGSACLSTCILLPLLKKYVKRYIPSWNEILVHIKPNIVLFIPLLASSVFHVMDKTMLGAISTSAESGYYYNADKLVNIPMGILNGLGTVFLPRMTMMFKNENKKESYDILEKLFHLYVIVACFMSLNIAGIAEEFVPWFFGMEFSPCVKLAVIFAPILLIKGISVFIRMLYLVPTRQEKIYVESTIFGAIVNFVANVLLITHYNALGAVIGTLIAETVIMIYQVISIRQQLAICKWLVQDIIFVVIGIISIYFMRYWHNFSYSIIINILFEAGVGSAFFLCFSALIIIIKYNISSKTIDNK